MRDQHRDFDDTVSETIGDLADHPGEVLLEWVLTARTVRSNPDNHQYEYEYYQRTAPGQDPALTHSLLRVSSLRAELTQAGVRDLSPNP